MGLLAAIPLAGKLRLRYQEEYLLKSLKVNGRAVAGERIYTLTTTDFVAQVDRAFKGIERRVSKTYPMLYRDLLAQEVSRRSPISAKIQGRQSGQTQRRIGI